MSKRYKIDGVGRRASNYAKGKSGRVEKVKDKEKSAHQTWERGDDDFVDEDEKKRQEATYVTQHSEPWFYAPLPSTLKDVVKDIHKELFLNFLYQGGYFIDHNDNDANEAERFARGWDGRSFSLTLLTGGTAWVPASEWKTLCRYYAYDYDQKKSLLAVNEMVKGKRRLILDLDFHDKEKPTAKFLLDVVRVIHGVVCRYFPKLAKEDSMFLDCLVLRTNTVRDDPYGRVKRNIESRKFISLDQVIYMNDGEVPEHPSNALFDFEQRMSEGDDEFKEEIEYKSGLHPAWNVAVTAQQGCQIIESARAALEKAFPDRVKKGGNSWENVVEHGPMRKGQLRMMGSVKVVKSCYLCQKQIHRIKPCAGCYGQQRWIDNRPYKPWIYLKGVDAQQSPDQMDRLVAETSRLVIRSSLHIDEDGPIAATNKEYAIPEGEPRIPEDDELEIVSAFDYNGNCSYEWANNARNLDHRLEKLPRSDPRCTALQHIVRSVCDRNRYEDIKVKCVQVKIRRGSPIYLVHVKGFGQHYCFNKGTDHQSNTVYFYASRLYHPSTAQNDLDLSVKVAEDGAESCPVALRGLSTHGTGRTSNMYGIAQRCWDEDCKKVKRDFKLLQIHREGDIDVLFKGPIRALREEKQRLKQSESMSSLPRPSSTSSLSGLADASSSPSPMTRNSSFDTLGHAGQTLGTFRNQSTLAAKAELMRKNRLQKSGKKQSGGKGKVNQNLSGGDDDASFSSSLSESSSVNSYMSNESRKSGKNSPKNGRVVTSSKGNRKRKGGKGRNDWKRADCDVSSLSAKDKEKRKNYFAARDIQSKQSLSQTGLIDHQQVRYMFPQHHKAMESAVKHIAEQEFESIKH